LYNVTKRAFGAGNKTRRLARVAKRASARAAKRARWVRNQHALSVGAGNATWIGETRLQDEGKHVVEKPGRGSLRLRKTQELCVEVFQKESIPLARLASLHAGLRTGLTILILGSGFAASADLLAQAGGAAAQAPRPATGSAPPAASNVPGAPPVSPENGGLAVDPTSYVIGVQDQLYVRVWREPDFTAPYAVRPDGKITLPLIGDVQASGLTPERLSAQLKQGLSDYINNPDVTVSVTQVNSKKYSITGEVLRPGEFPLAVPIKVFDALSNAGGFREFANKKKIIIIRGSERLKFNYNDIIKGKNLDQNIQLQNGDTVIVP
jgi:polysaccharide export outer membrane protein